MNFLLADFIILYIKNAAWGQENIESFRSESKHFLKPILTVYEQAPDNLTALADGNLIWPVLQSEFSAKVQGLLKVAHNVQNLIAAPDSIGETGLKKLLILRHLYTRGSRILAPLRDHQSSVGYTFPAAQILFNARNTAG